MPSDPQTWLAIAQLAVAVAGLLVTVWIALIVHRSSARIGRLEFARALRDSWIHIDDLTLRDKSLLRLANAYLPQRDGSSEAFGQKRIFLLAYLNPLITEFQGARQGMYGSATPDIFETIKARVRDVVADDDGYWVTQNHGHDPDFRALCREVRASMTSPVART